MDDDLLTPMDQFMNLVKNRKKIEDKAASKSLGVDVDTLSMWASALEKEGMIKIDYSLGKTYYVWTSEESEGISDEEPSQKDNLEDNVHSENEIGENEQNMDVNQNTYKRTIKASDINEMSSKTGSDMDSRLESDSEKLGKLSENFNDIYNKVLPSIDSALSKIQSANHIKDDIKDSKEEVKQIEQSLSKLKSEKDEIVKSLTVVEPKLKDGIKTYFNLSASAKEISKQLESFNGRMDAFSKQLGGMSKGSKVKPMQLREILRKYTHLTDGLRDLQMKYNDMFGSLEQFKSIDENIQKVKETLEGYNESIDAAKSDTDSVLSELKDIQDKAVLLRKEMNKYTKMLATLKSFVTQTKKIMANLGDFKTILKQKDDFSGKLKGISDEMEKLDSDVTSLKKIGEISTDFARMRDDFGRLRSVSNEVTANITKTIKSNDQYYANLEKVLNDLKPKLETYQTEMEGISKNVDSLVESNKKKLSSIKQTLDNIDDLSNSTDVLEAFQKLRKLSDLTENIETMRVELYNLSKVILKLKKVKKSGSTGEESEEINMRLRKPGAPDKVVADKSDVSSMPTTLSKEEEELFRKKQEDLRKLMNQMIKPKPGSKGKGDGKK